MKTWNDWWKELKPAECDEFKDYFCECWHVAQSEQYKKDAALTAAAPELLKALEALHSCHRAFSSNDNWTSLDDDARAFAESAIAKARGEA
jgi:hypothetical protein